MLINLFYLFNVFKFGIPKQRFVKFVTNLYIRSKYFYSMEKITMNAWIETLSWEVDRCFPVAQSWGTACLPCSLSLQVNPSSDSLLETSLRMCSAHL